MIKTTVKELPRYRAHKVVHALQIKAISRFEGTGHVFLSFVEEGYPEIEVTYKWYQKHEPRSGGYYVVYKDGYVSWSPQEAFEEGYTKLGDDVEAEEVS